MKIFKQSMDMYNGHENMELFVLSDLHVGEHECNYKKFYEFRDSILEKPNRFLICNGDLINNDTKTSVSDIYKSTMNPDEQVDKIVELLEPLKDRILILTEGNHETRTYKKEGILLTKRVAAELGIKDKYSEGAYLLFLTFKNHEGRKEENTYMIYGKHGTGGGRKVGGKVNRVIDMAEIVDADVYIHSHTHVPFVTKQDFFRTGTRYKTVEQITRTFFNSNAFLDYGGYGEEYGFTPSSIVIPKMIFNRTRKEIKALL